MDEKDQVEDVLWGMNVGIIPPYAKLSQTLKI